MLKKIKTLQFTTEKNTNDQQIVEKNNMDF